MRVLARAGLDRKIRQRLGASDVVQETLIEAHAALPNYCGSSDEDFLRWLRRILANNLANAIRDNRRDKRDIRRDVSWEATLEHSSLRLEGLLTAEDSTPSQKVAHSEEMLRLTHALTRLPDIQQEIVAAYHIRGCALAAIAEDLEMTRHAISRELRRALRELRRALESSL